MNNGLFFLPSSGNIIVVTFSLNVELFFLSYNLLVANNLVDVSLYRLNIYRLLQAAQENHGMIYIVKLINLVDVSLYLLHIYRLFQVAQENHGMTYTVKLMVLLLMMF